MKKHISLLPLFLVAIANAQVGIFENHIDIGKPKNTGSSVYDKQSQVYELKGSGYNIWFQRDEFHFLYNKIKGDFILTANFSFKGKGIDPHRKIGWMVRETTDDDASQISAVAHGDGLTVLQWRELRGAYMRDPEDEIFAPKKGYSILQLERHGKRYTLRAAHEGEPLQQIGMHQMNSMKDEVLAGLFICSHNADVMEEAKMWNVRIDQPVANKYDPYKEGFLGSRLEILSVSDGSRKVIYESPGRFEAPNWMPDGKKLLFNMDGSLYKISTEGGDLEKLNTDFANRNNNDHGISFNGKLLAISHHRDGLPGGGSTVYVLPLEGGKPKLITENTPSYWHGWNPNNKEVVYVAQRNGSNTFHIYKNSVDGGKEVQLTSHTFGHVDGPEYSPDGKYIYYNGSQSGTMQLWRMKPDGTNKEQITFDELNNWFPHISPDGKWIAYLSFPDTIDPDAHPAYQRVILKLMPVNVGSPKVIGYLYGGQGTINVPSWSPDSKYISFVSNSRKYN
jgi:Tol biopolymer transport system component